MFTWVWFHTDPNRSSPKIISDRPCVYMGLFWNQSGTDPNGSKTGPTPLQAQLWIHLEPYRSTVNSNIPSYHKWEHPSMLGGRATPQTMGGIVLKQNKVLGQVNINLKLLMANTPPPPPPPPQKNV